MKTVNSTSLLIGVLAGVTAALLPLGASSVLLVILFYACSAAVIMIAGLGWGNIAAIVAAVTAGFIAALLSPLYALYILTGTAIPAAWISHLANLARPASELGGPENAIAWYPLSDIVTQIALLVTIGTMVIGVTGGFDRSVSDAAVDVFVQVFKEQQPLFNFDADTITQLKNAFVLALPLAAGAASMLILFAGYYIATRITQIAKNNLRPREDMPSTLRMHRYAIFAFLGGLLLCFAGGTAAVLGALICGTFGAGFMLSGFAVFHFRTRGKSWRLPALWLAYLSVVLFTIPTVFFLLLSGLMDTRRAIALSPAGKTPETKDTSNT